VKDVPVLGADTSDGEYGDVSLCERCILRLLAEFRDEAAGKTAPSSPEE
jgi:hypothetical protein